MKCHACFVTCVTTRIFCMVCPVICCGRLVVEKGPGLNDAPSFVVCSLLPLVECHLGNKLPANTLSTAITKSEMKRLTQGSLDTGLVLYCCSFAIDQLQSSSLQMDMRPVLVDHPLG